MAEGACRFQVLGPLVFERDGKAVPLPSGRQRSLLALLLIAGGAPLSRDRLIDELWGERPPPSAVSALHVHLSKLRGLLGGLLVLEAGGYSLATESFELDAWRFDELVERARIDPEQARSLLGEALELFRGDPLCDVACEGSVAQWRRGFEDKRLQATVQRVDADLAAGVAGELVGELERLVAAHPFEERLWGQLMLAVYRAGRQADALEAYQRIRRLLAAELGLEPGEPLSQLQAQILARDPALLPGTQAPAAAITRASNLPRPPTRLVGRERELAALTGLMADPEVRMISLTGAGGIGKTRLLLELAAREEPRHVDGAVFVRLEQLTDPALVAAEIAGALAQRDGTDGPTADGLVSYLRERELLLVVDNFEHLIAAAVLLAELLSAAPRIRVLVSSRTALRIRGEQVFEVEPLELPADDTEHAISESAAVQMFLQCALAANRRLVIDPELTLTASAICRALDGLPLAIELAASRSQAMSPAQIAEQLAQPLTIGEYALRDLPDRQQTLQATIRWSYELLGASARELLLSAAVFLGGFTTEALAHVSGRPVRADLDELVDASLVRRQVGTERFELLELVRAFGLDELRVISEREPELRTRHRRYFSELVAGASQSFDEGVGPGELAAPLLAEHANLRSALENAIAAADEESAVALGLGLRALWFAGMLRQESQELVDRLLERFSISGEAELKLLSAASFVDWRPTSTIWNRRFVTRAAEIGDSERLALATANLFGKALNARDRDEMERVRPALLAAITPETSTKAIGWCRYYLALDAYVHGRFDEASEQASMSVENAEEIGHVWMLGCAAGTRLLAASARDGVITHAALTDTLERMRRPSVEPIAAFALWFAARYAAGLAPAEAGRWLAHAERIVAGLDTELWPEDDLRAETLTVLGISDLAPLLDRNPPLEHVAALDEAVAWLAGRDPAEQAPREVAPPVTSATV